jgi:hypothetical protein
MPSEIGPYDGRKARRKRCDACVKRKSKVSEYSMYVHGVLELTYSVPWWRALSKLSTKWSRMLHSDQTRGFDANFRWPTIADQV